MDKTIRKKNLGEVKIRIVIYRIPLLTGEYLYFFTREYSFITGKRQYY